MMIKNWILHIALTITTTSVLAQPLTKNINLIPDSIVNEVSSVAQKPDNIIAKSQDSLVAIQSKWLRNIRQSNIPEKQKRLLDSLSKKYNFSADFYAKWDSIGSNINLDQEGIDLDKVDQWVNKYQVKSSKIYTKGENVNPLQEKELAEKLNVFQSEVKQNIPDSTTLSQYKPDNIDQLVEEQALKNEQIQELQKQTGQTGNPTEAFTGKGDKLNQQVEQAQDPAYLRRQSAQKAYMVANDVAGEQMEQLQSAMSSMQKYKKKYFSVDNSADVDAGIEKPKRAEPLTKHWSWGGNFQFNRSNPLGIDLAPTLIYNFNPTFALGSSVTWRYKFDKANDYKPPSGEDMTYGLRLFGQYKVIRSFFIQAEYEKISMPAEGRSWQQAFNAGVGKTFTISGKLKGNITILYNLNHKQSGVYERPWLVRFGVMR